MDRYKLALRLVAVMFVALCANAQGLYFYGGGGGGGGGLTVGTTTISSGTNGDIEYNNSGVLGEKGVTGTGNVVLAASPTLTGVPVVPTASQMANSTQAASTAYVDLAVANAVAGTNPATAVQAATTLASNTSGLTYNNGVSGVGATFTGTANTAITIDGYTFTAVGQRLLVKNDTQSPSGAFNGIYSLTILQTTGVAPVFTRALDYDQPSDMNNTGAIPVVNGTANASTSWLLTSLVTTVGTTPLTYTQFTYAPSTLITTTTTLGGDLSGNLPNPTVAKINGVTVTGTPSSGQVPTATSSTAATWQTPSGGGGLSFPFTVVQEGSTSTGGNTSSYTVTFGQTTASSGNTIFLFCGADGSTTVGLPSGWTSDINQTEASYARLLVLHKATASDTAATFTMSSSTIACYYAEFSGSHTLDQVSKSGIANAETLTFPSITPSAGAAVFALTGYVCGGTCSIPPPLNPAWRGVFAGQYNTSSARILAGFVYAGTATATATLPPQASFNGGLFSGGGIAYATFSIL